MATLKDFFLLCSQLVLAGRALVGIKMWNYGWGNLLLLPSAIPVDGSGRNPRGVGTRNPLELPGISQG